MANTAKWILMSETTELRKHATFKSEQEEKSSLGRPEITKTAYRPWEKTHH